MQLVNYQEPDYEILESLYKDRDDLKWAWSKAVFPFNRAQWQNWFKETKERKCYSLVLKKNDEPIGHGALLQYRNDPGLVYFCFLIISKEFRASGNGAKLVELMCDFSKQVLGQSEVYLLVSKKNKEAIKCYKACGFKYLDGVELMRFKKLL